MVAEDFPRQAHLSLRWETKGMWPSVADALGAMERPEHTAAIALVRRERRTGEMDVLFPIQSHYEAPQRYRSRLYTYRVVVGSVDQLEALWLIEHQKALPGERGWQSAMNATPRLVQLVHDATDAGQLVLTPLREPILLRDAEGPA